MLGYMVNFECSGLFGTVWYFLALFSMLLRPNSLPKQSKKVVRAARSTFQTCPGYRAMIFNISRLRVPAVSFFHIFPANQSTVSSGIVSTCLLTNRQPAHFDCTASTCLTGLLNNSTNRCVNNVCMYNRY